MSGAPRPGDQLPALTKLVTQEKITRYADASGDHNPLHTDPQFASSTQFGGPIAHGMLVLSYLSELMTAEFGMRWLRGGRLKARFRGPARPGETVQVSGRIRRADDASLVCDLECRNDSGEMLITAEAEVPFA